MSTEVNQEDNVWADVEEVTEYNPYPYDDASEIGGVSNGSASDKQIVVERGSTVGSDVKDDSNTKEEDLSIIDDPDNDNINIAYFLANALKEKGIIDIDKIDDNISDEDVINIYANTHYERIRQDEEAKLINTLQSRGITEENLKVAMAIQNGYSPDVLLEQNMYKVYSELPTDSDEDVKENAIRDYRRSIGWADDEIEDRLQDLTLNTDKFDREFEKAKDFFTERRIEFDQQNEQITLQRERVQAERVHRDRELVNNVYSTGQIRDEKLTQFQLDEYRKAISIQEEVVDVGGQYYRASKFDKFLYEFNNDLETQLLAFKLMLFKNQDKERLYEEGGDRREDSIFQALQQKITKGGGVPKYYNSSDGRQYQRSKTAKEITVR